MSAYDFMVGGIYFNKLNDSQVEVTYKNTDYNSYLRDVIIPETVLYDGVSYQVTAIGQRAFNKCSNMKSVTIPKTVNRIGELAFGDCTRLSQVHIEDLASWCTMRIDSYSSLSSSFNSSNPLYYAHRLYLNGEEIDDIVIPDSVEMINSFVFADCTSLRSVAISNSVTRIGGYAFYGCTGLKDVTIPNSVVLIGTKSFYGCDSLTSLTIPSSVQNIQESAFERCTALTSVSIPPSVKTIDRYAFAACTGLTQVHIDDLGAWCNIAFGTTSSNPLSYAHRLYLNGEEVIDAVVPDTVTTIKNFVFYNCSGMRSVSIPKSVVSMGDRPFCGCESLSQVYISDLGAWCGISFYNEDSNPLYYAHHLYLDGEELIDVVIPDTVTTINSYAFVRCTGMRSVTIPNSISDIGDDAFHGCHGLTNVIIPNSVKSIGSYVFRNCSNLATVFVSDGVTAIGVGMFYECTSLISINLPNSITRIRDYAFSGCTSLSDLTIPDSLFSIGYSAFNGCVSLKKAHLPNTVEYIYESAFEGCTGLESIIIPNSVKSLGNFAFKNCMGLKRVTCQKIIPLSSSNLFVCTTNSNYIYNNVPLFVPQQSLEAYREHSTWKRFSHIVPFIGAGPGDIDGSGGIDVDDVIGIIGMILDGEVPEYADVNGDGAADIDDITVLINMLLNGH